MGILLYFISNMLFKYATSWWRNTVSIIYTGTNATRSITIVLSRILLLTMIYVTTANPTANRSWNLDTHKNGTATAVKFASTSAAIFFHPMCLLTFRYRIVMAGIRMQLMVK